MINTADRFLKTENTQYCGAHTITIALRKDI